MAIKLQLVNFDNVRAVGLQNITHSLVIHWNWKFTVHTRVWSDICYDVSKWVKNSRVGRKLQTNKQTNKQTNTLFFSKEM